MAGEWLRNLYFDLRRLVIRHKIEICMETGGIERGQAFPIRSLSLTSHQALKRAIDVIN